MAGKDPYAEGNSVENSATTPEYRKDLETGSTTKLDPRAADKAALNALMERLNMEGQQAVKNAAGKSDGVKLDKMCENSSDIETCRTAAAVQLNETKKGRF